MGGGPRLALEEVEVERIKSPKGVSHRIPDLPEDHFSPFGETTYNVLQGLNIQGKIFGEEKSDTSSQESFDFLAGSELTTPS